MGQRIMPIGILPPPLDADEQNKIISDLGTEHDKEARSILIEHNLRLVVFIAKKFDNIGAEVEDLVSIGTIGLIKAVDTFNPCKNIKLATYATRCIENEILMHLRRNRRFMRNVSLDEPACIDVNGNELIWSDILGTDENEVSQGAENEVERDLLLKAVDRLGEKERLIVKLRFGIGYADGQALTQRDVAGLLGLSQSYISRIEKTILNRLKKELLEVGF